MFNNKNGDVGGQQEYTIILIKTYNYCRKIRTIEVKEESWNIRLEKAIGQTIFPWKLGNV